MTLWTAVLIACALALATKLAGHVVPASWLAGSAVSRVLGLLPVALLAALVAVQTGSAQVGDGVTVVVDARVAGLLAAAMALLLRAPFLVVIVVAAAVAGGLRATGLAT